jgi:hypothetical protein
MFNELTQEHLHEKEWRLSIDRWAGIYLDANFIDRIVQCFMNEFDVIDINQSDADSLTYLGILIQTGNKVVVVLYGPA